MRTQAMKRAVTRNRVAMVPALAASSSVAPLAWAANRSVAQTLKELDAVVAPTLDASKRQNQAEDVPLAVEKGGGSCGHCDST
jgi:hypothetical protein